MLYATPIKKTARRRFFGGMAKTHLPKAHASFFIRRGITVVGTRFTCAITPTTGLLG
jgi:hypothetical protein